jgi:HK97 family phage portal protein
MGLVDRLTRMVSSVVGKATEGAWHPPPYNLPITHGWLGDEGRSMNWWQNGHTPRLYGSQLAIIEACLSAYSQTVAMCPGAHWRANSKGGRDLVTTSALSRILRGGPNDYQTISDFLLNATRQLYYDGNAYALCLRNQRFEIEEMHLMDARYCRAQIDETGEIFYSLGGNYVLQNRLGGAMTRAPARDVWHVKLHSDQLRNPLRGESPLCAAFLDIATAMITRGQSAQFYQNQAKPGFVLSTDLTLDKDQVSAARDRWNEQTTGANIGGTPILTAGLKPVQIPMITYRDAQLVETMKLSDQEIAMAFRVPLALLGIGSGPMGSTEALMQAWVASGLGFCLNHIELAFDQTFALDGQPDEYSEFDTKALLRSAFKDRIEGLARATQGGIMSPNEARNSEDLPDVKFGDEPRVQQQVVPLSAAEAIPTGPPHAPGKIPPAPPPPSSPPAAGTPPGTNADARAAYKRIVRSRTRQLERRAEYRLLS